MFVKPNCATCLKQALINYGPIAVVLNANNHFMAYENGIFNDINCCKCTLIY